MADPDFTSDERQVLGALMMPPPDAPVSERTIPRIALLTGLSEQQVTATLHKLEEMDPPVVHRDTDAKTGDEFWIALNEAAERLDPPTA